MIGGIIGGAVSGILKGGGSQGVSGGEQGGDSGPLGAIGGIISKVTGGATEALSSMGLPKPPDPMELIGGFLGMGQGQQGQG